MRGGGPGGERKRVLVGSRQTKNASCSELEDENARGSEH